MLRILTIGSEVESAKRLGLPIHISKFKNNVEKFNNDIIIRWGNSNLQKSSRRDSREFKNVINDSNSISKNCHKYLASVELSKVVKVPKLFETKVPNGLTVVVRPINHASGNDFKIKKGPINLNVGEEYASEFIDTDTEIRAWFINDKIIIAKRVPLSINNDENIKCRSNWGYSYCYKTVPEKLRKLVMAGAKVLGLEFGCADILVVKNEYYFLEYNTAPSVDQIRLEKFFKNGLMELCQKKFGVKFDELANFARLKKENYHFPLVEEIRD